MKWFTSLLVVGLLSGCASLGATSSEEDQRQETWALAHQALAVQDFDRATALFRRMAQESPTSREGRESLFFLGTIQIDPRNAAWNPEPAEQYLRRYLAADSAAEVEVPRRAEAEMLLELARQLNMPVEQRVPGLQPEPRVVRVPERVVAPAQQTRALAAEVERLRRVVAERDAEIQKQREELERIRKTLTGRGS